MSGGRRVLVLSDTHGRLRPEVLRLAREADVILHAGDVGRPEVLQGLRAATPGSVHAVRGNVDQAPPLSRLPPTLRLELEGVGVFLLHDLSELGQSEINAMPSEARIGVVVSGHTHTPQLEERGGVLYLNPGSAGPRRFRLPVACAWLHLGSGAVRVEPVLLEP